MTSSAVDKMFEIYTFYENRCLVCISLTDLPVNLLQCNWGIMLRQCYRGSKAVKKRKSILTKEDEERSLCFSIMVFLWQAPMLT